MGAGGPRFLEVGRRLERFCVGAALDVDGEDGLRGGGEIVALAGELPPAFGSSFLSWQIRPWLTLNLLAASCARLPMVGNRAFIARNKGCKS